MPFDIQEQHGSPIIGTRRVELRFFLHGEGDEDQAYEALGEYLDDVVNGLHLIDHEVEQVADTIWSGRAFYGEEQPEGENDDNNGAIEFQFDTTGATQHITQSIATVSSESLFAFTTPDFQGAIGVTDSSVEGVDVVLPSHKFSETHTIAAADFTQAYRAIVAALTGRTNSSEFRGFEVGEVLFLGATGGQRGTEDAKVTFHFAVSKNREAVEIGAIEPIDVGGWEYLWVYYQHFVDTDMLVKTPTHAFSEQVYHVGNFALLGIGE